MNVLHLQVSGLMLASHTSIRHLFSKCLSQYEKLRKKQAFLDNYRKFPMFAVSCLHVSLMLLASCQFMDDAIHFYLQLVVLNKKSIFSIRKRSYSSWCSISVEQHDFVNLHQTVSCQSVECFYIRCASFVGCFFII